jgi:hypothetical protein
MSGGFSVLVGNLSGESFDEFSFKPIPSLTIIRFSLPVRELAFILPQAASVLSFSPKNLTNGWYPLAWWYKQGRKGDQDGFSGK